MAWPGPGLTRTVTAGPAPGSSTDIRGPWLRSQPLRVAGSRHWGLGKVSIHQTWRRWDKMSKIFSIRLSDDDQAARSLPSPTQATTPSRPGRANSWVRSNATNVTGILWQLDQNCTDNHDSSSKLHWQKKEAASTFCPFAPVESFSGIWNLGTPEFLHEIMTHLNSYIYIYIYKSYSWYWIEFCSKIWHMNLL